jgi:hypothetical protein
MKIYFDLLIKSHFYITIIVLVVYAIERITGKLILYQWFKYKKDIKSAEGSADREALLYFLFNLGFSIYKAYIKKDILEDFSLVIWLLIIIPLAIIFRKLYHKYQGVDPSMPDFGGFQG